MVLGCADDANELPRGVEASIWASDGWAHIVFKTRKHRPRGSWLKQKCICAKGKAKEKFCVACRLQQLSAQRARRQRMWTSTASQLQALVRKFLTDMGHQSGSRFTLKGFRAGRATEMARSGSGIAAILVAGEWRSKAWLAYVNLDECEHAVLMQNALDEDSDGEA